MVLDAIKDLYHRKVREVREGGEDVYDVSVSQKELKAHIGDDMERSSLHEAKKSLNEKHKLIEKTEDGNYVPTDREYF